jgi:trehalose 6-phosphate synthase
MNFLHPDPDAIKCIMVSNRSPYVLSNSRSKIKIDRSIGGLATALEGILKGFGGKLIAWDGKRYDKLSTSSTILDFDNRYKIHSLKLSRIQVESYYDGFCNKTLWPLCHNFLSKSEFSDENWKTYVDVNKQFAAAAFKEFDVNSFFLIHDFHLCLTPRYIRNAAPNAIIGFFWHVPFPPPEIFLSLPWASEIVSSMLKCDWIGFHIDKYTENFLNFVRQTTNFDVDDQKKIITVGNHIVKISELPLGVDWETIQKLATSPETKRKSHRIRKKIRTEILALSVDRLDYTKGILQKLNAIHHLFIEYPELTGKFSLLQIAAPTRTEISEYSTFKDIVKEEVNKINGRFANNYWLPIYYQDKCVSWHELIAYYKAAEILLVTPLRDGLNLVAKEFVASRDDFDGVIVLSEFAGVAEQFSNDAILVNPYATIKMVHRIKKAISMLLLERQFHMKRLREKVSKTDLNWWYKTFTSQISQIDDLQNQNKHYNQVGWN